MCKKYNFYQQLPTLYLNNCNFSYHNWYLYWMIFAWYRLSWHSQYPVIHLIDEGVQRELRNQQYIIYFLISATAISCSLLVKPIHQLLASISLPISLNYSFTEIGRNPKMAILTTARKHSRIITATCEEKSLPDPDNFTAKTTVIFQNQKRQQRKDIRWEDPRCQKSDKRISCICIIRFGAG